MKHGLFYLIMIFFLSSSLHANEQNKAVDHNKTFEQKNYLSILKESLENGSATSLRADSGSIAYGGFSLNRIASSKIIQYGDRKTIYPIYVFFGIKAPWRLSPFIELGGDLGEMIIDSIFRDEDEENVINTIDYYYSAGLNFSITDKFLLSLYAKKYNFLYEEYVDSTSVYKLFKSRPTSYGVGIGMQF